MSDRLYRLEALDQEQSIPLAHGPVTLIDLGKAVIVTHGHGILDIADLMTGLGKVFPDGTHVIFVPPGTEFLKAIPIEKEVTL